MPGLSGDLFRITYEQVRDHLDALPVLASPEFVERRASRFPYQIPAGHLDRREREHHRALVVIEPRTFHLAVEVLHVVWVEPDRNRNDGPNQDRLGELQKTECFAVSHEANVRVNGDDKSCRTGSPPTSPNMRVRVRHKDLLPFNRSNSHS